MSKENQEYVQTTIRVKREIWLGLRRLQEIGKVKSINHEANKHFEKITKDIDN